MYNYNANSTTKYNASTAVNITYNGIEQDTGFQQPKTKTVLSPKELTKYGSTRINVFKEKMKNAEPFITKNGPVLILNNYQNIEVLNKIVNGEKFRPMFLSNQGLVRLSQIYKTPEFGGKGAGGSTIREDTELKSLNDQLNDIMDRTNLTHVNISVNGVDHKVVKAESTPGTPKSDFHLVNENNEECVWISHKHGYKANDFQQWGGVSKKEFPETPGDVQSFVSTIKDMYGDQLPNKTTVAMKIGDEDLKNKSVYGIDYGADLGRQNVSILMQGPVRLEPLDKNRYELSANNIHYNGDKITGDFEPVLMAIYKGDRSNFGIKGARFGISPMKCRKVTEWL